MGFFQKALGKYRTFGAKAVRGVLKLGQKMNHGVDKAVNFIEKKGLPIAHKISHIGAKALKIATPAIGVVAPEAIPVLLAGQKGLSMLDKATGAVEKGIKVGKSASRTLDKFRKGDVAGGIQEAKATGKQAQELHKNPFKK